MPTTDFAVSVVIATYNRRDMVAECVRSVLQQSEPVHQVVVVSDGSADDTVEHLRAAFPEILVLEQSNFGESVARNHGIAHCTGDWIAFLDDDDLWHRDKNRETTAYLRQHPDCKAVATPSWYFSEKESGPKSAYSLRRDFVAPTLEDCHVQAEKKGKPVNDFQYLDIKGESFEALLERNRGGISTSTIRRDTLITAGCFPPSQDRGEDWTLCLNVARLTEWHLLDRPLVFKRMHEEQQTNTTSGAVPVLTGYLNAWLTGRPLPDKRVRNLEVFTELARFGGPYSRMVQSYLWGSIKAKQWGLAQRVFCLGLLLLPRTKDRIAMLTPPFLAYRFRQLERRLGKKK
ncbi:glycosyltransferase family 2 protein [bacterium]|nr:MAG: glycosyltransferase family 2 protein [bacterium]